MAGDGEIKPEDWTPEQAHEILTKMLLGGKLMAAVTVSEDGTVNVHVFSVPNAELVEILTVAAAGMRMSLADWEADEARH